MEILTLLHSPNPDDWRTACTLLVKTNKPQCCLLAEERLLEILADREYIQTWVTPEDFVAVMQRLLQQVRKLKMT